MLDNIEDLNQKINDEPDDKEKYLMQYVLGKKPEYYYYPMMMVKRGGMIAEAEPMMNMAMAAPPMMMDMAAPQPEMMAKVMAGGGAGIVAD